jgi:hypothetical protein
MNWLETAEPVDVVHGTDMRKIVAFLEGEMQGYGDRYGWKGHQMVWFPFQEFDATMTFDCVSKGRSSVKFHFTDEYGTKYEMFMKDAPQFVNNSQGGKLTGRWGFVKRGANYGIQLLGQTISE